MVAVWRRCADGHLVDMGQDTGSGLCAGYVYPNGAERATAGRRFDKLVCYHTFEKTTGKRGSRRKGHVDSQWLYCWWRPDGCGERYTAFWWL